ncbi:MAG TPA: DMT family transporter [Gaiellaceae bacterium]|nr:DMT family transporter [Gaiellaceae bacterium]
MSGGTALAVVMSVSAGFAGSIQAAVLGRLGDRVGTVEAVGFSTLVAGATGIVVLLVARRSVHGVGHAAHEPVWMWLGGILSAFIVLSITFAAPRIGVAAAIGLVITGNLVVAAAIDRFGWFGVERIALEWTRVVGILLLAGGAALLLRR